MKVMRKSVASLLVFSGALFAGGENPLGKDRTGMVWVLPFTKAQQAAKERGRLLLIKPVAFGTSPDGGW